MTRAIRTNLYDEYDVRYRKVILNVIFPKMYVLIGTEYAE